jgi:hypothetical protein
MTNLHPHKISSSENNFGHWWDKIKGVGQKRAEWLKGEFDVDSIFDFAKLSIDEIDTRVQKANNIRWRRDEIENSLARAREFIAEESKTSQQDAEFTEKHSAESFNSTSKNDGWEYIAAFNVEFKVRKAKGVEDAREICVRPVEITKDGDWGDAKGEKPTPVEGKMLFQWMLEHLPEDEQQDLTVGHLLEQEEKNRLKICLLKPHLSEWRSLRCKHFNPLKLIYQPRSARRVNLCRDS